MPLPLDRRAVLVCAPAAGLSLLGLARSANARVLSEPPSPTASWPGFPKSDPALARTVVGAAHRDEAKVRELVDKHPSLANAVTDWGFGDWETALGAAAHTGRRSIAEYLISKGARVDLFAATMLGWLDAVKSVLASSPGIERTLGPHCLTLLHHARAGGDASKPVADFLSTLPGADNGPKIQPLDPAERAALEGEYSHGPSPADRFTIRVNKEWLEFSRDAGANRIHHLGNREFFPAGVPSVRFRFDPGAPCPGLSITDHDLVVTARRAG